MTSTERYRGWLPNVSGRLSFSTFGDTTHPTRSVTETAAGPASRYIISYQARNTSDVVLPHPGFLGRLVAGLASDFIFLCIARTERGANGPEEYLRGRLYMFNRKSWKDAVKEQVVREQTNLAEIANPLNDFTVDHYSGQAFSALSEGLISLSDYSAKFETSRNGITEIEVDEGLVNSDRFDPDWNFNRTRQMHLMLTAQLFFFLRDIGHRHRHHNPRTDTLVDIYRYDGSDDIQWRLSTLYRIYRKIITLNRSPKEDTFDDALGLIAYADTFQKISLVDHDESAFKSLSVYHSENMKLSVAATRSKMEYRLLEHEKKSDTLRNWILGGSGFVISVASLLELMGEPIQATPSILVYDAAISILEYPVHFIVVIYVFFQFTIRRRRFGYATRSATIKNIYRLLQAFPKFVSVTLIVLCGILLIGLAGCGLYYFDDVATMLDTVWQFLLSALFT